MKGQIQGIGTHPRMRATDANGITLVDDTWTAEEVRDVQGGHEKVVTFMRATLGRLPTAIGHRVVHGGPDFSAPIILSHAVVDRLDRFSRLLLCISPTILHQSEWFWSGSRKCCRWLVSTPPSIAGIPRSPIASRFPKPTMRRAFAATDSMVCRTNTSRAGSVQVAPEIAEGRVVVAHLGSGASMCAISAGRSVESTMGFTALDGLPMGTRARPDRSRRRALSDDAKGHERQRDRAPPLQ